MYNAICMFQKKKTKLGPC